MGNSAYGRGNHIGKQEGRKEGRKEGRLEGFLIGSLLTAGILWLREKFKKQKNENKY